MSTGRAIRSPAPVDTHFGHNLSFAKFHLYRCLRAIKWEKALEPLDYWFYRAFCKGKNSEFKFR